MHKLERIDLSFNRLIGYIPHSFTHLYRRKIPIRLKGTYVKGVKHMEEDKMGAKGM